MQPFAELESAVARGVRGVFVDIDGTLTDGGRLGADAYAALWRLHDAGVAVVPVTGRPAGWCDLIARQWPVAAVVGENGAFALWQREGRLTRLLHPAVADPAVHNRLELVREAVLAEVPGSRVAGDQPYRLFDLAIDFREEPPDLGLAVAQQIRAVFERFGARAKISDIHVNGWFGDYDKLSMVQLFVERVWGETLDQVREQFIFFGDSPNDEPMFAYFPHAAGVANVRDFIGQLTHLPRYVAQASGGAGFAEMVELLLRKRQG